MIGVSLSTALALALSLLVLSDAFKPPHGELQRCEAPLAVSPFETETIVEERASSLWLAEVSDEANAAAEATLLRFRARQFQTAQAADKVKTEAKAAGLEAEAKARAETEAEAKRIPGLNTAGGGMIARRKVRFARRCVRLSRIIIGALAAVGRARPAETRSRCDAVSRVIRPTPSGSLAVASLTRSSRRASRSTKRTPRPVKPRLPRASPR